MRKQLLILLALLPLVANAYDAEIDGIYYEFSYMGNGVFVANNGTNGYSGDVVIPASVTYNDKTYSVISIGSYAFYGCSGLTSVTIPNSVTGIGNSAFSSCSSLTSIIIPNSVISIGDNAFYGCFFASSSFVNNSSLTNENNWGAVICDEETTDGLLIKDNTVVKCRFWATSVTIPNSVTSIGNSAFSGCSSLSSVTIPNSVTSIGDYAFSGCYFVSSSFINNSSLTSDNNWGANICDEETTDGLLIKDNTVVKCRKWATSVTIPNSVTSIGEFAFTECNALASLNIGKGITSIGSYAFNDCKLRNVLIKRAIPPTASNYSFSEQTFYHTTLYVPTGSWDNYAYDNKWYKFINIRETAMVEEQLSMQQAYTLMDASTFAYSVYDPVNICIGNLSSVGINEDNPNHSWQVIESGSSHYLYNVGAKKFVVASANGSFALSDTPTSINMENGDNGIIIGTQTTKQWALVTNERLSAEQAIIDGIDEIPTDFQESTTLYDLNGRQVQHPSKGIYIRNGKKVLVK